MKNIELAWMLVLILPIVIIAQYTDYSDLPPGPYCGQRRVGCCNGRQDRCAAPIIGTMCYCDDFCNRTRGDCCPDFLSTCKGIPDDPQTLRACHYKGKNYPHPSIIKENCNICKCEVVGERVEMLCENKVCLMDDNIISAINNVNHGWSSTNYSKFWGRELEEGIKLRLGTLQPHRFVKRMVPIKKIYDLNSLPRHFDAAQKWPGYISKIQDQGWCGSSWAISTVATASDRFAVLSQGMEKVELSAQNLLSCNNRGQQSCNGGYLDKAWLFLRKYGVVDENCYPYSGFDEKCRVPRVGNLASARCDLPRNVDRREKYKVGPAYRINNETDIMYEITESGPVQATMKIYHDFFSYQGGIYKHSDISTIDRTGYHSVRIVGWGEEQDYYGKVKKYWKVANSWGEDWGENGYFRIVRGRNECEIESFVLAAWPLTVDPISKSDVYGV